MIVRGSLIGLGMMTFAARAVLASEATEHAGAAHAASITDLFFPSINFAIFLWVLWRYALPGVRGWVRERHDRVVRILGEAASAKAVAEQLRLEWEERMAHLDETIVQLRAEALRDAERERDRILAAAVKTVENIRRDAERAAAYETRRAQQALRAELVQQALRIAEDTARTQWSTADQQRSLDEFLKQVRP